MMMAPTAMSRLAADSEGSDDDRVAKFPWVTESHTPTPRMPHPPSCRGREGSTGTLSARVLTMKAAGLGKKKQSEKQAANNGKKSSVLTQHSTLNTHMNLHHCNNFNITLIQAEPLAWLVASAAGSTMQAASPDLVNMPHLVCLSARNQSGKAASLDGSLAATWKALTISYSDSNSSPLKKNAMTAAASGDLLQPKSNVVLVALGAKFGKCAALMLCYPSTYSEPTALHIGVPFTHVHTHSHTSRWLLPCKTLSPIGSNWGSVSCSRTTETQMPNTLHKVEQLCAVHD